MDTKAHHVWLALAQRAIDALGDHRREYGGILLRGARPDLPDNVIDVIEACLWADPDRRPSLAALRTLDD
jgi:hypothetical protein